MNSSQTVDVISEISDNSTLKNFISKFGLYVKTPNGVSKLRELILFSAVSGKLIDSGNNSTSDLLNIIKNKREELLTSKRIKKSQIKTFESDLKLFDIPKHWEWVSLGSIAKIVGGGTPKSNEPTFYSEDEIPWITPADMRSIEGKLISRGKKDISSLGLEKSSAQLMPQGSVLFSSRAPIGYVAIAENALTTNQGFKSAVPYEMEMNEYLYWYLRQVASYVEKNATGTTFKEVSGKIVGEIPVSLPPLEEQKRIVAKVDELMALCDQLEAQQQQQANTLLKANTAAIQALFSSTSKDDLTTHWQRLADNFHTLFGNTLPMPAGEGRQKKELVGLGNIKLFRKAILQLGVTGRLVAQDEADEPVGKLLERIVTHQNERVENKEIKRSKRIKIENSLNFKLPGSWETALINDISFVTKLAGFEYSKYVRLEDEGEIPVVRAQNVKPSGLKKDRLKYIDYDTSKQLFRCALDRPSLLVTFIGAGIGDVCIFEEKERWHLAPNVAKIELFSDLNLRYVYYVLNSPLGLSEILKSMKSTAQPSLSMGTIREIFIPVPPLEEQKRIVAKVDQLMTLCDQLEQQLTTAYDQAEKLITATTRALMA